VSLCWAGVILGGRGIGGFYILGVREQTKVNVETLRTQRCAEAEKDLTQEGTGGVHRFAERGFLHV